MIKTTVEDAQKPAETASPQTQAQIVTLSRTELNPPPLNQTTQNLPQPQPIVPQVNILATETSKEE
jgi:hypothetical protein